MKMSKNQIDKSGRAFAKDDFKDEIHFIESEDIFNEFRKSHLLPLTQMTLEIQEWLSTYNQQYYIAQRLKRKPQIIRKLRRLSVRLTQLQDIGGARIIVETNADVDNLYQYLIGKISEQDKVILIRVTDYRQRGRDITGYRALHLILLRDGYYLELQLRSRIQHYWAESIERTSVIYGYSLKEQEGHDIIIQYFKELSDVFCEIELGREPSTAQKILLDDLRQRSEELILASDKHRVFDSYVNDGIIKTLSSIEEGRKQQFINWIIIFDWNSGAFVSWDIVDRDPDEAIRTYVRNEDFYPPDKGYEVVLIGASDVSAIRQTHSHYFGIEQSSMSMLENLDESIVGFSRKMDIDVGARQILHTLHRRNFWGVNVIRVDTLKNHLCKNVLTFGSSLDTLIEKGLVLQETSKAPVSLNIGKKKEIENYL